MFKNYLKIAFRNLLKYKTFSTVNLLGLATGTTVFLLLLTYLNFHRSFDRFNEKGDRVYRVPMAITETGSGTEQTFAFTFPALAPHLLKDYPEVEEAARFRFTGSLVKWEDKVFRERPVFVDESVFRILSLPFAAGDPNTAFKERFSAVITEETAKKYFGEESAIGKVLKMDENAFTVRGVIKDIPENSHLQLDIMLDYPTYVDIIKQLGGDAENNWGWSDFYTYVLLKPGASAAGLQAKLPDFAQKYMGESMKKDGFQCRFDLQPLYDIHAHSTYDYELGGNGNFKFLPLLGAIALLIMLIAWINFINLSTARSLERAKEVGVRKAVGAGRGTLIRQFITEAFFLNLLAFGVGLTLFYLVLPLFAKMVETPTLALQPTGWQFWLLVSSVFAVGALLSGFYPAFVLSGFKPITALHNTYKSNNKGGNARFRKALVVGQFATAMLLITGTLTVYKQLKFMRSYDLGVNIDQTLVLQESINRDSSRQSEVQAFLEEVQRIPGIKAACASTDVPGKEIGGSVDFRRMDAEMRKRCRIFGVDDHFFQQYDFHLAAGRWFSDKAEEDRNTTIINEEAVKVFGFANAEEALGHELEGFDQPLRIVGVIKDYHQEALRFAYNPTVFYPSTSQWDFYSIKSQTSDMPGLLTGVEKAWKAHLGDAPFQYFFLDEFYDRQYRIDRLLGKIMMIFTSLIVFVACLGLFGLSSFTVSKRTKEIGIRRVLGATTEQIVALVSREYLLLILVSGAIALPLGWWGVQRYLQTFALRTEPGVVFYLLPLALLVFVAFSTTILQSVKAALGNPVESLRSE